MKHSRIPQIYRGELGGPLHWQDDATGALPRAVHTYVRSHSACTSRDLEFIADYLVYYIKAPCWETGAGPEIFAELRSATVETLNTVEAIEAWLDKALDVGIDPF